MKIFIYALQTAFKSLWHEKWLNMLTILSIALSLLILSAFATITINADSVLKNWSRSFGLVVYLEDGLTDEAEKALGNYFKKDSDVTEVKYISKDNAASELRLILGENAPLLDELKNNPLPSSFELKLKRELLRPAIVKNKADEISRMSGIEDVQFGDKWLSSLNTITNVMKAGAMFLGSSILLAIIFITYNTIKILFYRKSEEIETLKLLGATKSFIRLPFMLEGLFIGIIGGIISSAALFGTQMFIATKGTALLPPIKAMLVALPLYMYLSAPALGAFMSLIGCFIAVGKIKY